MKCQIIVNDELRIMNYFVPLRPKIAIVRNFNYQFMFKQQIQDVRPVTFHHFGRKGYNIFNSLKREVRIGVLTIATLSTATTVKAEVNTISDLTTKEEAIGDEKDMAEVTVSGTMAPLTQLQSARIVSVITCKEIEQAGAQSVNDLLKLATGVDVRQRGGFGIQTDISIDGGTYEQVTILLNGVNISNPHTGHLAADFPVSISDIERIEVLEGAASRVYGGQAFGGAINIVTKTPQPPLRGEYRAKCFVNTEAGIEAGSWGTVQGDARVALQTGRVHNSLSGGGGRSDGGTTNDAWQKGQLFYRGLVSNDQFDMNWQFGFSRKSYDANTFYSGSSNDQWEQNERYLVSVGAETKGKLHLLPQIYWNRTYDNYQWHKGTPNNSHQCDVYGAVLGGYVEWWGAKTAFNATIRNENILSSALGTPMDSVDFVWAHGAEKQYTKQASRTSVSYSLEHTIPMQQWTISAGVTANMTTSVDSKFRFYPGVDISYRPATSWKIYLSYNEGFRLPSFTDLYYNSPDITGNNRLKPEHNRSVSLGVKYYKSGLTATGRVFYNHGHNMIDYVKQKFGDAAHADNFDLDCVGAQADVRLDFATMLHHDTWLRTFNIGYTYLWQQRDGKYDIFTSLYADDYLRHKLVASLNHKVFSKLSATWAVRFQDRMGSYQVYDGLKATDQLQSYDPYATLDLKLQWTDKHYEVYVNGKNITNHRYYDLGNIQQPGICVMAGARVKF